MDNKVVYIRVDSGGKEVEFSETWESIKFKRGRKKKFLATERGKILRFIFSNWKSITPSELRFWKAPEWVKVSYLNSLKTKVYTTYENNQFYIKFEHMHDPIIIYKSNIFFNIYNKYYYLYSKILELAEYSCQSKIEIYTDILDLLRINRMYYSLNNIKVYVNIAPKEYVLNPRGRGYKY